MDLEQPQQSQPETQTTSTTPYVYAGFFRRWAAAVIDGLILFIPSIFIGSMFSQYGSIGFGILLGLIYRPVFESSVLQATPGKALLGVAVLSEQGQRLTFKAAVIRFLCSYISFAILCIGYLMQIFTAKRQTLHDMIAEAIVIRKESSPDTNYFTVWRDQFKIILDRL